MATGQKLVNMYTKKVVPGDEIRDNWIEYQNQLIEDNLAALYPTSGFFGAPPPVTVSSSAIDTFEISSYNGLQSNGVDPVRRYDYAGGDTIPFENAATDYWVQTWLALAPEFASAGLEGSPEFGTYRYSHFEEQVGYFTEPDSVSDLAPGVRLVIDDVLTAGEGTTFDQSGRQVTVMLWPDPMSLDPAVAFQTLTVQWSGTNNYVDAPDYLGDTAIRAAAQYRVFVPVCTISKSNPTGDGNWVAKITGNPGGSPTVFDYSGQTVLGFSPSTITAAFQREHTLTGGSYDGLHDNVHADSYSNRSAAEGGAAGTKLSFQGVDGSDYGQQFQYFDHVGGLRWMKDGHGQDYTYCNDYDLSPKSNPFLDILFVGYTGEGSKVATQYRSIGLDDEMVSGELDVAMYIGGGNYPAGLTCTTKNGGTIDVTGVPDMTTDPVLVAMGGSGLALFANVLGTTTRNSWYVVDVLDADTLTVANLDGSSVSWTGDEAGTMTFYLMRRQTMVKQDSATDEALHLLVSPFDTVMCQGDFVMDRPPDGGTNQFFGWGFAYYDINRDQFIFEARASGAAAGMSFAGNDECISDPAGITGPSERWSGFGSFQAADDGDLLLYTGNDSSGSIYFGRPHEGTSWSWLTYTDLYMALTPTANYSMKSIHPWTDGLSLGTTTGPLRWDIDAKDLGVGGSVVTNLIPSTGGGQTIGDATFTWDAYFQDVEFKSGGSVLFEVNPQIKHATDPYLELWDTGASTNEGRAWLQAGADRVRMVLVNDAGAEIEEAFYIERATSTGAMAGMYVRDSLYPLTDAGSGNAYLGKSNSRWEGSFKTATFWDGTAGTYYCDLEMATSVGTDDFRIKPGGTDAYSFQATEFNTQTIAPFAAGDTIGKSGDRWSTAYIDTIVGNPSADDRVTIQNVLRVTPISSDPSSPSNGDIWYNSTSNELKARVNGATVVLA